MLEIRKLVTINTFLKKFTISRKIIFIILLFLLLQAVSEAFSAGLLIPFLNSFQNIEAKTNETSKVVLLLSQFFNEIEEENKFVYILLVIMLMMSFVQCLVIFNNRLILRFTTFGIENKIAQILFSKILNTKLRFFYTQRSGNLINHLTRDTDRCNVCINRLLNITSNLFFVIGYVVISLLIMPLYTIFFLIVLGMFLLCFKKILPYIYSLGAKNHSAQQDANNVIVETMHGFRNIILSTAQETTKNKFGKIIDKYYSTLFKSLWITTSLPAFIKFLSFLLIGITLFLSKGKLIAGGHEFFSKMIFFIYVIGNIFRYMGTINSLYSGFAFSYEGIVSLLKLDVELDNYKVQDSLCTKRQHGFSDNIIAKNLSFEYVNGAKVLNNMSFSIMKNKRVAFVGSSGSGKSTLVDIISGFHDDYAGSITIDGLELKNINKNGWRGLLGYVSQETFIFNDTVKNNLLFGFHREINEHELIDACKKAQIYETIMSFNNKFDTVLGERGIRLSGGEKQRLAIARLFLKDPLIVLLDEATSALDSASEKRVKDALDILGQGRTVVSVAHRLSTIADFDQIYVLEKGEIVEFGTHMELIARKDHYYKYYLLQSLEN